MQAKIRIIISGAGIFLGTALPSFGQDYSLSGTVRELERITGAPLQEVRVDVDSSKFIAFTNADGTYSINGIPSGTHNIRISKPGFIGIFKKDYTLDGNKTFNISLADTIQESPQGTQVLKLDEFRELPPFDQNKGLNRAREDHQNSNMWYGVTEGNLIPVRFENATPTDSARFKSAIGACNGNWQNSPDGSVEKEQKRAIYLLTNDPQVGVTKRGILVQFNAGDVYTEIIARQIVDNYEYIHRARVKLLASIERIIQKEVFGRCFEKQRISAGIRASYMNTDPTSVTDLDQIHNTLLFNHWAAIPRGEQNATIYNMENTPIFVIPIATNIIKPLDNASNLEQNVQIQYNNKFGTDRYRLQASDKEDFSNILKDLEVHRIDTVLFFDKGKEYFLRVRPENVKGNAPWSNIVSFTTRGNTAPGTFTILTPIHNQTAPYINKKLEISSSAATDIDGDPLNKTYHVTGPDLDTLIHRNNTEKAYIDSARLKLDTEYQIVAEVSDGMLITPANNNPVKFRTQKPNGIEDPIYKNFKAYPIPVRDYLNIEYDLNTRGFRKIYSLSGLLLNSKEIFGEPEIVDMTGTPRGVYIIQLSDGKRMRSLKIIRE